SEIQGLTGLPVAGWGLVWSAVAFSLGLAGLSRAARGRSIGKIFSAVRVTAIAGAAGVLLMLAASFVAGAVCLGGLAMGALVAPYAVIALRRWRPFRLPHRPPAAPPAARGAGAALPVLPLPV